jgi:hypothetical protein
MALNIIYEKKAVVSMATKLKKSCIFLYTESLFSSFISIG